MFMYVYVCMWVCMWGPEVHVRYLYQLIISFSDRVCHWIWNSSIRLGSLASVLPESTCLLPAVLGPTQVHECRGSEPRSLTCTASTLPTESSPKPLSKTSLFDYEVSFFLSGWCYKHTYSLTTESHIMMIEFNNSMNKWVDEWLLNTHEADEAQRMY